MRKIISWLYKKYCDADLISMTRKQVGGIDLVGIDLINLSDSERRDLSDLSDEVLSNKAFQLAVDSIKIKVLEHIRDEAKDATAIFCDRFTINGLYLLKEELESYKVDIPVEGEFNPYSLT